MTEEDLSAEFGKYGKVADTFIPRDRATMRSRGFGFVTFDVEDDAKAAIDGLNE